jgi:uncharacterized membrane protein YtjA (UPF0391 family)
MRGASYAIAIQGPSQGTRSAELALPRHCSKSGSEIDMLKWALIFAVVALIAGALGFGGIAGAAAGVAKFLFFLFVIGFLIFLALGVFAGRKITGG